MSKEIVDGIRNAIEEAQRVENLRAEQEIARQQAETLRREGERQALIARNEARLRATGVVALFEELRDSGVLKISERPKLREKKIIRDGQEFAKRDWRGTIEMVKISDYEPAVINWNSEKSIIQINFDMYGYPDVSDGSPFTSYATKFLRATISENGKLQINEHEMKPGEKLEGSVRDEILRLKGLKE